MKLRYLILTTALIALVSTPAFADDPSVTIKNYVGKITIETSPKYTLDISNQTTSEDVDLDETGSELIIDGGIDDPDGKKCKGYYGKSSWSWFGRKEKHSDFGGYKDLDDYPNITVTAPKTVKVIIDNAIPFGNIGDIGSADISMPYCGQLDIGTIASDAIFNIRGSGDINAGDIGNLYTSVRGSGDVEVGNVAREAKIKVTGSGDIALGDANVIELSVTGSGDVSFGDAETVELTVTGSGDVEIGSVSKSLAMRNQGSGDINVETAFGELNYESRGSGDLEIEEANGNADIDIGGSGDVEIDQGDLNYLKVRSSGASHVDIGGVVKDADLRARGASDIYLNRVTGALIQKESGAADINVSRRD